MALLLITHAVFAFSSSGSNSFYSAKEKGWFWYEPEPEPEPEPEIEPEEKEPPAAEKKESYDKPEVDPNAPKGEVVVDVKWLRENLPLLRDAAIDNPSYDNVRRYYYAQRVMMDKATKFATVSTEVSTFETALDETLRRPENQIATFDSKIIASENREKVLKELTDQVGLFYFYSSTCNYCRKQSPLLKRLQSDIGIDILAVSLDGKPTPNGEFPDYVTDTGALREKLQVTVTPTIYLVKKDGSEFHNIATGLTSPNELMRNALMLAKRENWISEEAYNSTKDVKEILLNDDTKEKLYVDPDKVFDDPNYLADKLRAKFQSQFRKDVKPLSTGE